ncbi:integrase core domain-containing protein [Streptomyces sp. NPDC005708]|uniref:integrase core domain-containing protein n=1 Tax=Streptomyces sp. NPDC005708 TaxID=3154564 RepID=UPI0033D92198
MRREALDHVLIMNEAHARQILAAYQQHYNGHRPHRARNRLPPGAHVAARHRTQPRHAQTHPHARSWRRHQRVQIHSLTCSDDFPSPHRFARGPARGRSCAVRPVRRRPDCGTVRTCSGDVRHGWV